jgi:hypothetical protein
MYTRIDNQRVYVAEFECPTQHWFNQISLREKLKPQTEGSCQNREPGQQWNNNGSEFDEVHILFDIRFFCSFGYIETQQRLSLSLSATRCVRRLLKACTPGHTMPRQRVSTSQTPEYHNPSAWTVDLSIRSHIQRIGYEYI